METWEEKNKRIQIWINELNEEQKNGIILELVEKLIDMEEIYFWEYSKKPYWRKTEKDIDIKK